MALSTAVGQGLSQIQPASDTARGGVTTGLDKATGLDFRNALDQATRGTGSLPPTGLGGLDRLGGTGAISGANPLKFSAHAVERMRSRGISFEPEMMKSIEGAVQKAAQKGSKDTLILAGESALIVSVKNNTVVTVMDKASMRENVFTNIDSTVVL